MKAEDVNAAEREIFMPLLVPAEVAKWLRVSVAWARDHATRKSPRLPAVKAGKPSGFALSMFVTSSKIAGMEVTRGPMASDSRAYNAVPIVHTRLKAGRERGQNAWLEVTGNTRKLWRGHFYMYEPGFDGNEVRRHRSILLTYRNQLTRRLPLLLYVDLIRGQSPSEWLSPNSSALIGTRFYTLWHSGAAIASGTLV